MKMKAKRLAWGCAIIVIPFLAFIFFLFWLYHNPWAMHSSIRVSGQILHSATNEPATNASIVIREYGWRGIPVPNLSGRTLQDRRTITVRADANGKFTISFKDDWIEISEIRVDGETVPDFDVIHTNHSPLNASIHRGNFSLRRLVYREDPEIIVLVFSEARPVPETKWRSTQEFIPRDQGVPQQ